MKNLIKKNSRYSKRINYDALRDLFEGGAPGGAADEKVDLDEDLYTIDADKADDDEAGVVIEEGGGGVGMAPSAAKTPQKTPAAEDEAADDDAEAVGEVDEELYGYGSDKGEEYGEWDAYEQEV